MQSDSTEQCENCGDRKAVGTRTVCLDVPELDEKRVKTLELCRLCADAFDWGSGEGPVGHGLPEARSVRAETNQGGQIDE